MRPFIVYLLRCADGSYYCGQTDDIDSRMLQHVEGKIGYTATRKPAELVWQGEFEKRMDAIAFERQVKGWSRAKKEALIAGDWDKVSELSKPRSPSTGSVRTGGGQAVVGGPSTSSGRTGGEEAGAGGPSTGSGRTGVAQAEVCIPSTSSGRTGGRQAAAVGPSTGSGRTAGGGRG